MLEVRTRRRLKRVEDGQVFLFNDFTNLDYDGIWTMTGFDGNASAYKSFGPCQSLELTEWSLPACR
jgi:hypothetical protein